MTLRAEGNKGVMSLKVNFNLKWSSFYFVPCSESGGICVSNSSARNKLVAFVCM